MFLASLAGTRTGNKLKTENSDTSQSKSNTGALLIVYASGKCIRRQEMWCHDHVCRKIEWNWCGTPQWPVLHNGLTGRDNGVLFFI